MDLLSAEPLVMLNAAFCQQHRARCPPSEQLLRECAYVRTQLASASFTHEAWIWGQGNLACPAIAP